MGLVSKVQAEVLQADDKCTTVGVILSQSQSIFRRVNMLGSQGNISFNLTFLKRFWRMHRLFYSLNTITSIAIFILFIGLSVADVFVGYRVGLISGNFYSVLVDKDSSRFLNTVLWSSFLILVISLIKALKPWLANRLTARWRQSLTSVLQTTYLKNLVFYRVKNSFENPDQRLTADIASMTDSFGSLVKNDLFVLPGAIIYYAYKAYGAAGWIGPTGMFGLFLISLINKIFMGPVIRKKAEMEKREGSFRYLHVAIRENSEAVAFQDEGSSEQQRLDNSLSRLASAQINLADWTLPLELSVTLFSYIGAIASYLVISIPIFAGYYDDLSGGDLAQVISNNSFVCMQLVWQFTQLVSMSPEVANMAGSTHRVGELLEEMKIIKKVVDQKVNVCKVNVEDDDQGHGHISDSEPLHREDETETKAHSHRDSKVSSNSALLELCKVEIMAPEASTPMVRSLSFSVSEGERLLISGPSGSGKTSILRVIRGLWEANQGQVKLDSSLDVFFFPQGAWLPPTSLRELVTGDSRVQEEKKGDAEVKELLELTGLGHLLSVAGGLDGKEQQKKGIQKKEQHWTTCISPGERQRLLFSRLLFRRPSLALLDEASSAIGEEIEARLYGALKERGITVVTIGHRSCLRALHDQQITLDAKGGWELTSLRTDTIE